MAKHDFSFFHALRVRWSEVDMQAIVFNGNYLNYFDVAFTEYWRELALPDVIAQAESGLELFLLYCALLVEYLGRVHAVPWIASFLVLHQQFHF